MSERKDFVIRYGELLKYTGPGGDVVIPDGVKCIQSGAFRDGSGVTSLTIPASVRRINTWSCSECSSLEAFHVNPENKWFRAEDGVLFDREMTTLHLFPANMADDYAIPEGVTHVADFAFHNNPRLRSVTIPNSVKSIGTCAFANCRALFLLEIPPSVEQVGSGLASPWTRLRIEDVYRLPIPLRPAAAAAFAAAGGGPDSPGYEQYRKYIRNNNPRLLPEAMREPALLAFMCRERLITPANTERYLEAAVQSGDAESSATLVDYQANKLTAGQKNGLRKRRENEQEKRFARQLARRNRKGIAGLKFVRMGHLTTFYHPNDLRDYIRSRGGSIVSALSGRVDYLIINDRRYYTKELELAEQLNIDVISEREFNDLAGRTWILDGTVLKVYYGAGGDVTVPRGVTVIGVAAFLWAPDLVNVVLPETVTAIEVNAFAHSPTLRTITIPASVTDIDDTAFDRSEQVVIRGARGSEAEAFASRHEILFEEI